MNTLTQAQKGRNQVEAMALPLHAEVKAQYHYNLRQRLQAMEHLIKGKTSPEVIEEALEVIADVPLDSLREVLEATRRKENKRSKKVQILEEMEEACQLQYISGKAFQLEPSAFDSEGKLKGQKDTIFQKQYKQVDDLFDHFNSQKIWAREESLKTREKLNSVPKDWQDTLNIKYGVKQ